MTHPKPPAPTVKGWCPGAHRPMMSGDGLVFRVRPFFGELSAAQALGLCDLAERYGNGMLDLTSRANLQIRGVSESDQNTLLEALDRLGVIDVDPAIERHRNILMPPDWEIGDLTHGLYLDLVQLLPELPDLPEKMGFAIDTGSGACLRDGSADFRFEIDHQGALILRADGADGGRKIARVDAMHALKDLALWFVESGGLEARRMARHLATTDLPSGWDDTPPRPGVEQFPVGSQVGGTVLGAPFGKIAAADMRELLEQSEATGVRAMLGRKFVLRGAQVTHAKGFANKPSRLMEVHACPGAPYCSVATVETVTAARALAPQTTGSLHVSGCAKGCAFPRLAETTLVGRDGGFDLVKRGRPWDVPCQLGLSPDAVMTIDDLG